MRQITWAETDDCIEWSHARSKAGYGQTYRNGKVVYVHRVVWEQVHGRALAVGEEIRHTCDNKPCFNPRHLLVGSRIDNVRDAIERNRMRYPNRIPNDIAAGWVERYRAGESSEVLAREHGCSLTAVIRRIRLVDPELTRSQHGKRRWLMPGGKKPGPSIRRPEQYEALKEQGMSKSRAAAISNEASHGPAARSAMAKKGAKSRDKGTARKKR